MSDIHYILQLAPANTILERYIKNDRVGMKFAEVLKKYADPYTPYDTGALQNSATLEPFKIHYSAPYANRLFHGSDFNFKTEKHPLATSYWVNVAYYAHNNEIAQEVNDFIAAGGK